LLGHELDFEFAGRESAIFHSFVVVTDGLDVLHPGIDHRVSAEAGKLDTDRNHDLVVLEVPVESACAAGRGALNNLLAVERLRAARASASNFVQLAPRQRTNVARRFYVHGLLELLDRGTGEKPEDAVHAEGLEWRLHAYEVVGPPVVQPLLSLFDGVAR